MAEDKVRCGHCGTETLMFVVCEGEHQETNENRIWGAFWALSSFRVLLCPACNEVNVLELISDSEHDVPGGDDEEELFEVYTKYLFPNNRVGNPMGLPSAVERSLAIAIKPRAIEPIASAAFARKSLEAICADRGHSSGRLEVRIDKLAESGVIPTLLRDVAHSIRLVGNDAVHELDASITKDEAEMLIELCNAIIGYVYDAPRLLKRLQERIARNRAKGLAA